MCHLPCNLPQSPVCQVNEAGRPMEGAAAKLALSRVLGVSALRAAQMYMTPFVEGGLYLLRLLYALYSLYRYHGSWRGCIDEQPLRSLAELRAAVAAGAPSDGFAFGLEHYEVPAAWTESCRPKP